MTATTANAPAPNPIMGLFGTFTFGDAIKLCGVLICIGVTFTKLDAKIDRESDMRTAQTERINELSRSNRESNAIIMERLKEAVTGGREQRNRIDESIVRLDAKVDNLVKAVTSLSNITNNRR